MSGWLLGCLSVVTQHLCGTCTAQYSQARPPGMHSGVGLQLGLGIIKCRRAAQLECGKQQTACTCTAQQQHQQQLSSCALLHREMLYQSGSPALIAQHVSRAGRQPAALVPCCQHAREVTGRTQRSLCRARWPLCTACCVSDSVHSCARTRAVGTAVGLPGSSPVHRPTSPTSCMVHHLPAGTFKLLQAWGCNCKCRARPAVTP